MRADDCGQHHQLELEQQEWLNDPVAQVEYKEYLDRLHNGFMLTELEKETEHDKHKRPEL